jgi:hypothetical protein
VSTNSLKTGKLTDISLDHDLGDDEHGTGYDGILWIEEAVATTNFLPLTSPSTRRIHLHDKRWNWVSKVSSDFPINNNNEPIIPVTYKSHLSSLIDTVLT